MLCESYMFISAENTMFSRTKVWFGRSLQASFLAAAKGTKWAANNAESPQDLSDRAMRRKVQEKETVKIEEGRGVGSCTLAH